jgi:hypothetical protein
MRLIAGELIKVNQHLKLITGWMEGQEHVSRAHNERMQGIEGALRLIYDIGKPYGQKIDAMAICMVEIAETLRGVTELAKSTFEMLTAKGEGGEHGGAEEERQRAAVGP